MAFNKGQSGNPGGRPKEIAEVRALARKHAPEAIEKLAQIMKSDNTKSAVAAAIALLDRGYGRPAQTLTADPESGPLIISWMSK